MRQFQTKLITFFMACSFFVGAVSAQGNGKPSLHVATFESPVEQLAWVSYGIGLATFVNDHNLIGTLPAGDWEPSFDAEVSARQFQVKVWDEAAQKQALNYEFMDQMELVVKAGFLKEYIWRYYKRPNWSSPEGLRMSEFDAWVAANLPNHQPITGAKVTINR